MFESVNECKAPYIHVSSCFHCEGDESMVHEANSGAVLCNFGICCKCSGDADRCFISRVDGLNNGDVCCDVATVLNTEGDVGSVVLARGVVVEGWFDVSSDTVAVCNISKCVLHVVVSFDVVNFVERGALDDVFEHWDEEFRLFDVDFTFSSEVADGDEGAAVASECTVANV